ncbi:MAG: Rieske 2Fe-2S domain-containing protein, partial [Onishia taeanensis]
MSTDKSPSGPDLADGIPLSELAEGEMLTGHVGEDAVLLARSGGDFHAVGAHCTHYGAPLGDGLIVDDSVRCPWHHACFSLRSGEALAAPALDGLACWKTEVVGDRVH